MIKKLPIGIQDFAKLRSEGYAYVDKTALLYDLASKGCYYFLSRPRRFGKSLFLSTIEAYFLGKRELFKGLAIEELEDEWARHTVLRLDLNTQRYDTADALNDKLEREISMWEGLYGANPKEKGFGMRFEGVIERACEKTGRQVVILVDEYDKPILQAIGDEALQKEYRAILKGFYGALKSCDRYIRFAFLTGVTKFGKVSVFSDLNHLIDLSMLPQYYNICGITEAELRANFNDEIVALANNMGPSVEEAYKALKENYDGYRFTAETSWRVEGNIRPIGGVYNPFSILNALQFGKIGSYWFETGTPTYLVELLKMYNYNLANLVREEQTADELNSVDPTSKNPIPVIYQSGYLTVKDYDRRFGLYKLGYPNKEVEEGFVKFLMPYYTNVEKARSGFEVSLFVKEIETGDMEGFMERLQSFLSACPYELQIEQERHFQSVMYILSTLCGFYTEVETHTSKGRMDMTVRTGSYIYVFEFKFNSSAQAALEQIAEKGYADRYRSDSRETVCIGVNYSSAERNINEWTYTII